MTDNYLESLDKLQEVNNNLSQLLATQKELQERLIASFNTPIDSVCDSIDNFATEINLHIVPEMERCFNVFMLDFGTFTNLSQSLCALWERISERDWQCIVKGNPDQTTTLNLFSTLHSMISLVFTQISSNTSSEDEIWRLISSISEKVSKKYGN